MYRSERLFLPTLVKRFNLTSLKMVLFLRGKCYDENIYCFDFMVLAVTALLAACLSDPVYLSNTLAFASSFSDRWSYA